MRLSKKLEQQIAVFGESGSGKTVLLSSFYGSAQEPQSLKNSPFHVLADDIGQGQRLHKNYLGMRDSAETPNADKFRAHSFSFTVKLKDEPSAGSQPFNALRLVVCRD